MRTNRSVAALIAAAVLALAAVPVTATAAGARVGTREVTHEMGTTKVPAKPARVVAASLSVTGNLLALGAPVVASGTTVPSKLTDANGFFTQWADVATRRGVTALGGPVPSVEAIAAQRPDVIVGSANGADAVTDLYDELSRIAPTIVIDASGSSWQEVTTQLAKALGLQARAKRLITKFDKLAGTTAKAITVPTKDAVAMVYNPSGGVVFTPQSAQGKLLTQLGFTVVEPQGSGGLEGGNRSDVAQVSLELLPDLIGDATTFLVFADDATLAAAQAVPVLANTPSFQAGRAFALGNDSFRIDYYSATNVTKRIGELLG